MAERLRALRSVMGWSEAPCSGEGAERVCFGALTPRAEGANMAAPTGDSKPKMTPTARLTYRLTALMAPGDEEADDALREIAELVKEADDLLKDAQKLIDSNFGPMVDKSKLNVAQNAVVASLDLSAAQAVTSKLSKGLATYTQFASLKQSNKTTDVK